MFPLKASFTKNQEEVLNASQKPYLCVPVIPHNRRALLNQYRRSLVGAIRALGLLPWAREKHVAETRPMNIAGT